MLRLSSFNICHFFSHFYVVFYGFRHHSEDCNYKLRLKCFLRVIQIFYHMTRVPHLLHGQGVEAVGSDRLLHVADSGKCLAFILSNGHEVLRL